MPNRLGAATSPYLLQHADNPVDWWEWGEDALAEARRRDVPVLLSVGYASCHWCHVMAHESFEDPATAAVMNERFVNVKVDREERPDVDRVYMDALQAISGRGGWPMTVFLTPSGIPFFAGTYFPPDDMAGHPSFLKVLDAVHGAWEQRRDTVTAEAERLAATIARPVPAAERLPGPAEFAAAHDALAATFDAVNGGFGLAPKFPQAPTLEFLLRSIGRPWGERAEEMLTFTLTAMARGGIYDHLGGGFSRYAVDERWRVPHFEKMLYDNALLARLYAAAHQVTGEEHYAEIARQTLDYLLADMSLESGGFASAEDADSEGEEGLFYVFDHDEFVATAGPHAEWALAAFGVTPEGDLDGRSVLHEAATPDEIAGRSGADPAAVAEALAEVKRNLLEVRGRRERPGLDDKAVAAWNGLAIRAFAEAGAALAEPRYIDAARRAASFVLEQMRLPDGRLLRSRRGDRGSVPGFCDDYAAVALGCFALYAATGETRWFTEAAALTEELADRFWDEDGGGFFATAHDAEKLIARPKNLYDNPTPSDNALAAEALLALASYTGERSHRERAEQAVRSGGLLAAKYPIAAGWFLSLAVVLHEGPMELAVVSPADGDPGRLLAEVHSRFTPGLFPAVGSGHDTEVVPLLRGRPPHDGLPTAYLCRGFSCDAPTTDPAVLAAAIDLPGGSAAR